MEAIGIAPVELAVDNLEGMAFASDGITFAIYIQVIIAHIRIAFCLADSTNCKCGELIDIRYQRFIYSHNFCIGAGFVNRSGSLCKEGAVFTVLQPVYRHTITSGHSLNRQGRKTICTGNRLSCPGTVTIGGNADLQVGQTFFQCIGGIPSFRILPDNNGCPIRFHDHGRRKISRIIILNHTRRRPAGSAIINGVVERHVIRCRSA